TPGQRVAKNHHVRRQLCRPCSFPLSQNLAWRCTKQCNPVPNVRLFRAPPPKSTHPQLSRSFLYPSVFSKHPNKLGLVCVKTRAEQEPELGIFGAAGGHPGRHRPLGESFDERIGVISLVANQGLWVGVLD